MAYFFASLFKNAGLASLSTERTSLLSDNEYNFAENAVAPAASLKMMIRTNLAARTENDEDSPLLGENGESSLFDEDPMGV